MNNITTYIGLDVHITNYTICAYTIGNDKIFAVTNGKVKTQKNKNYTGKE